MKVDIENLLTRIEEIYSLGAQEDGTHTRMAYSKEDVCAREQFIKYAKDLQMEVRTDAAGNIFLKLPGEDTSLPSILMGSHLDTVPDGGKFDGVLGCVAGLGVCEAYIQSGKRPRHSLEVVVFTDEEGFRFGKGLLGSSAICGQDPDISKEELDIYGNTREEVFTSYQISCDHVKEARRDPKTVKCFVEMHIEQGGTLDKKHIPLGIVSSIAGVNRYELTVTGVANHAGSTTMADRKDALVSAAKFIGKVPEVVKKYGNDFTVATVGTIKVTPHSVNVIPGTCTFSLEIRDQSEDMMDCIEKELKELFETICALDMVQGSFVKQSSHEPAPMAEEVQGTLLEAAMESGYPYEILPSGAFHDSLIMSSVFKTGMLFVPSIGGISHSRYEDTAPCDIEIGCEVLLKAIEKLDEK